MQPQATSSHYRDCHLCPASCGLKIQQHQNRIVSIKGDERDPLSQGYICSQATLIADQQAEAERIEQPLLKTEQGWQPIAWPEAIRWIRKRIKALQKKYGTHAIASITGPACAQHPLHTFAAQLFTHALGSHHHFSLMPEPSAAERLAQLKMFGPNQFQLIPDLDQTECVLCLGSNLAHSNSDAFNAPNAEERLQALKARGGTLMVIDPHCNETAQLADQHFFIQPGTDALFLLGLLHLMIRESWVPWETIETFCSGLTQLNDLVSPFTPEKTSVITKISVENFYCIGRTLSQANSSIVIAGAGLYQQENASLIAWLVTVINLLTGHSNATGGMLFHTPPVDLSRLTQLFQDTAHFDAFRSHTHQRPELNNQLPLAALAEEITSPGKEQIKALFCLQANPLLAYTATPSLLDALQQLECFIVVDTHFNETNRWAHLILPTTTPLEHSQMSATRHHTAVRSTVKLSPALLTPPTQAKPLWQIMLELSQQLKPKMWPLWAQPQLFIHFIQQQGPDSFIDALLAVSAEGKLLHWLNNKNERLTRVAGLGRLYKTLSQKLFAELNKRTPWQANFSVSNNNTPLDCMQLRRHPHGLDLGAIQPQPRNTFATADGKIQLAPGTFTRHMQILLVQLEEQEPTTQQTYRFITRDHTRNNWGLAYQHLVEDPDIHACALMNNADGKKHHLQSGDKIIISTTTQNISIRVQLSNAMMPGVISLPQGWGYALTTDASTEITRIGVAFSAFIQSDHFDPITRVSVGTAILVNIKKAAGEKHIPA